MTPWQISTDWICEYLVESLAILLIHNSNGINLK